MKSLIIMVVLALGTVAFGADAVAPVATPAASTNFIGSALGWLTANQGIAGMLVIAIIDFILAINPAWKSNGALHFIYTLAQGKAGQQTTPAA